jgi:hypothetical protein
MASPIEKRNIAIITLSILLVIAIIAIIIVIVTKPKTTTNSVTSTDCSNCGDPNTDITCTSQLCTWNGQCSGTDITCPVGSTSCTWNGQCSGNFISCPTGSTSSCSINYPTNDLQLQFTPENSGYVTPTYFAAVAAGQPDGTSNSVFATLSYIQSFYPFASIATDYDLFNIAQNVGTDCTYNNSNNTYFNTYSWFLNTNVGLGYPSGFLVGYPCGGSISVNQDPGSGVIFVWVKIPTMDSASTVDKNLNVQGSGYKNNTGWVLLL